MNAKGNFFKKLLNSIPFTGIDSIKKEISIKKSDDKVIVSGELSNKKYIVKELYFKERGNDEVIKIGSSNQSSSFSFSFNPRDYFDLPNATEVIFDPFLLVRVSSEELNGLERKKIEKIAEKVFQDDKKFNYEFSLRIGQFAKSNFELLGEVIDSDTLSYFYVTEGGNISYAINKEMKMTAFMNLNKVFVKNHEMVLKGTIFTQENHSFSTKLLIVGRNTNNCVQTNVSFNFINSESGISSFSFLAEIDFNQLNVQFVQDVYDLFFELSVDGSETPVLLRVGNPTFYSRSFRKASYTEIGNKILNITPYFTIKKHNLSFQIDEFDKDVYSYVKKVLFWLPVVRPFYQKSDIWLVGEKPYKAQDTGFHFFKYMRTTFPKKKVFYVIEKNSPELRNVEKYGNILFYKSKKHVWHTLMATRIIGSHSPDDLYPMKTREFLKGMKAKKVFLQHGIMGTKNMVHLYGADSSSFDTDLFFVSSDFEKKMIVEDFHYEPNQVKVTGLSRFDSLLANDVQVKRQILIIPTWRDWLLNDDVFKESEYFNRYKSLISNHKLHEISKKYNFDIVFCLHPNMQKYTSYFEEFPVRVISQGEVDVQLLLKESAMMITDYSSVAFDFSLLHKPIIYYQFDRDQFIGKKGSHLDLDNDLPGDILYDESDIFPFVERYAQSDFKMKESYINRASKFLKYRDLQSSSRIYKEISNFNYKKSFLSIIRQNRFLRSTYKKLRKSNFYFPLMRVFYQLVKTFVPIDKKLIVFESGVGKQYSDSPRAIYEELVQRKADYKFVWICNKKIRFANKKTIRINRLGPRYFYYLARARFWVNNQNFPTYLTKRKGTTYIQTWHGTPLKKMLFDIENVQGRTSDYVERIYKATKTWDYLVSPSPYATNSFKSAFRYSGKMLEVGYPRNDIFYQEKRFAIAKNVKRNLKIPSDKKVILYAPTFRDNQTVGTNKFVFDLKFDLHQMKEKLGDDYVLLLRMHVAISNKLNVPSEFDDFVYNVSDYSDIQELFLMTDVLITDYSSVFFDFANSKKPILFFTYDLEEYRDETRGFYMNLEEESPGPLLRTNEEVIDNLLNIGEMENDYKDRYVRFYEKYCGLEDGQASKRVVDLITNMK